MIIIIALYTKVNHVLSSYSAYRLFYSGYTTAGFYSLFPLNYHYEMV